MIRSGAPRGPLVTLVVTLLLAACARPIPAPVIYADDAAAGDTGVETRRTAGVVPPRAIAPRVQPNVRFAPAVIAPAVPPKPAAVTPPVKPAKATSPTGTRGGFVVIVGSGDTLSGVAAKHGVPRTVLARANNVKFNARLRAGQKIVVPRVRVHVVRPGETLFGVARRYGVPLATVMRANGLARQTKLTAGRWLGIPVKPSRVQAAAQPRIAAVQPKKRTPHPSRSVKIKSRSSGPFAWPVRGRIISGFGAKRGGLKNDGINIAVAAGVTIRAAKAGVVVYAGNELPGFGNLLLIRHAGGYTTAYAHTAQVLVHKGQRVARGQEIAKAGSTGNVDRPQLHFEIRRGAVAVDPMGFLRRRSAGLRVK